MPLSWDWRAVSVNGMPAANFLSPIRNQHSASSTYCGSWWAL